MPLKSTYYDGVVTESDRAKNLAGSPEYGVYGPEDFKVTAHPSIPFAVLVKKGKAHGHGVTDEAEEDQVVQCATLSGSNTVRWDLIAVRRNWQPELGGPSTLEVLQAGADPKIPDSRITGPGVEDDQPIFLVKWKGGVSAPVDFIDLRVWSGNGGLYAKHDLVRSYLGTVGTEININGVVWQCRLIDNDAIGWRQVSPYETTIAKPDDVPWREFRGLVRAVAGTDANGYGELRFGQLGLPSFAGVADLQLTAFHPTEGFMFVLTVQEITTTRIRFRARRLDNSGWANGYQSISMFVNILGW